MSTKSICGIKFTLYGDGNLSMARWEGMTLSCAQQPGESGWSGFLFGKEVVRNCLSSDDCAEKLIEALPKFFTDRAAFLADYLTRMGTPSGEKKPKFPTLLILT